MIELVKNIIEGVVECHDNALRFINLEVTTSLQHILLSQSHTTNTLIYSIPSTTINYTPYHIDHTKNYKS